MRKKLLLTAAVLLAVGIVCFIIERIAKMTHTADTIAESKPTETTLASEALTEAITEPPVEQTLPATVPHIEAPAEAMVENVPFYTQKGVLPTGCELVSAKMVLEFYMGEEVLIKDIVDNTTCANPQLKNGVVCAPHPEQAFIGTPWDDSGFGCFAPVIAGMMERILPERYEVVNTSGRDLQELAEKYIPEGTPILVWATISMVNEFRYMGWYLMDENGEPTKDWYNWLANEHCLVLIGYDENYYYFNDPYKYSAPVAYRCSIVNDRYTTMGRYSLVVQEKETEE